ncbi:MAG: alpha-glucan family phosphorylase [Steroidobacteraceae bacterium]
MNTDAPSPDIDSGTAQLRQLALDLRWCWNHGTDELWRQMDPELWARTHNPWVVVRTVSQQRLARMLGDAQFRKHLDGLTSASIDAAAAPTWFEKAHPEADPVRVAYFSMEFMLSEALPIYAGGLGNVAGDQLKAASDLGVPVVGVGLLYSQGYFRQIIGHDGAQQALYPYNDPGQLPVTPMRTPEGDWLRLEIRLPGYDLWLRVWQVKVGRLHLYLLDSNDIGNYPAHRGITSELYGGGPELRLQQEIVLGIGGWRVLEALHLQPKVCHLNEGHAAFAILDRARAFMQATGVSFDAALTATRAGNIFTTHTAVPAGFDRFAPQLVEQYLAHYAGEALHISMRELLALGRENASDDSEPFNMAYLAVRGCAAVNGVSRLHGEVSRHLFLPLFPRRPAIEVPIGHVTNGVHTPSWDSPAADELWTGYCGKDRWLGSLESVGEPIRRAADSDIWRCRTSARNSLIDYARERLSAQLAASGGNAGEIEAAKHLFNPEVLTLGFARRFATYKRPNLLLRDPERLARLLTNPRRPVQLILAGKAHPADLAGQAMIRDWVQFVRRPDVRPHAIFLSDYDMLLTERLVEGVDVWINTPRRPWEACGTSGMKVLVNGGLNLSELDGWWAEAYAPSVGWALGDGREHGEDPAWDDIEASQLYELLESQVIPEFYARDGHDIPRAWVARVRESMAGLTPICSANRSVREYMERCYVPAAASYRRRSQNNGALAVRMSAWRQTVDLGWPTLRFGRIQVDTRGDRHYFTVEVDLGVLEPQAVQVELYAEPVGEHLECRQQMTRLAPSEGARMSLYVADVAATRAAGDYTARIVPTYPDLNLPLEAPHVLWQR